MKEILQKRERETATEREREITRQRRWRRFHFSFCRNMRDCLSFKGNFFGLGTNLYFGKVIDCEY